jgi:hypothetical protein
LVAPLRPIAKPAAAVEVIASMEVVAMAVFP